MKKENLIQLKKMEVSIKHLEKTNQMKDERILDLASANSSAMSKKSSGKEVPPSSTTKRRSRKSDQFDPSSSTEEMDMENTIDLTNHCESPAVKAELKHEEKATTDGGDGEKKKRGGKFAFLSRMKAKKKNTKAAKAGKSGTPVAGRTRASRKG